tara:strand:+ start:876 stop:1043 length:168 start_codon:yes stop_codon:yes gene_type:complete
MSPEVFVVIIVYNFEHIIINKGSTDRMAKHLARHTDPQTVVSHQEKNLRIAGAPT